MISKKGVCAHACERDGERYRAFAKADRGESMVWFNKNL